MLAAQGAHGGRRGGVAGDDDGAAAQSREMPADGQDAGTDERVGLGAVGQMGGIGEIDQIGARQGAPHRREYRQAAQPGIEHPDHERPAADYLSMTTRVVNIRFVKSRFKVLLWNLGMVSPPA